MEDQLKNCRDRIREHLGTELPCLALVLGSGFQDVEKGLLIDASIQFTELPGFPAPLVKGHAGELLRARIQGLELLVCSGRAHFYEGVPMESVVFPIRALAECGVSEVVLTNAAGGINPDFRPGDFMLLTDHINFIGVNPLRGLPLDDGRGFLDLSDAYSVRLRDEFKAAAQAEEITLREGVYLGVGGPTYETPAEIKAFRRWGADAVGMSTIPEVLMARYCGMEVAAISCITNLAAGMHEGPLTHLEVLQAGRDNAHSAARLLGRFASRRSTGETVQGED